MTTIPAVLQEGLLLTTSEVVQVTGATNSQTLIKRPVFTNITNAAVTLTVTHTPSGGSPLTVIPGRSIAALSTDLAPELVNMVLLGGDAISAMAGTASAVNCFVFGFVVT